jgi:hypothetical protein
MYKKEARNRLDFLAGQKPSGSVTGQLLEGSLGCLGLDSGLVLVDFHGKI